MNKINNYYLSEIYKIPLLTLEEEKVLAAKAFGGDKSAQKKLVEHNLRFVVKIANQYRGYMDIEDLINEGNMGLIHAAEKFDPSAENKFSTYAVRWIKAYIQKAIRETSTGIRFPAGKLVEMKEFKMSIASLDKTIGNDGETPLESLLDYESHLSPEDEIWDYEDELRLKKIMGLLKKNERTVIAKRFGLDGNEPMSLSEVGALMGCSKERILRIEQVALLKLKKGFLDSNLAA